MPQRGAAVTNVCATSRFPEVMPELAAVAGIERPDMVGSGHVEHTVDLKHGAFDA